MLRRVEPQWVSRRINAKGRWFGRLLVDVTAEEFKASSREQHLAAVTQGKYSLRARDGHMRNPLREPIVCGDVVHLSMHRHEPPIPLRGPPLVCHSDEQYLVVDKPCGIPVHPTGQYFHHTLVEQLRATQGPLWPCHRLDRVTSGLMIFARTPQAASKLQRAIQRHDAVKVYLARVQGKFPGGVTLVDSPVYTLEPKRGFPAALGPSRDASTQFELIKYDASTGQSLVQCTPRTGRTHQIRIHLARLGFPIVNDQLYNESLTKRKQYCRFVVGVPSWESLGDSRELENRIAGVLEESRTLRENKFTGQRCPECATPLMRDPDPAELELYLHSWKYRLAMSPDDALSFETPRPSWW
ncbi:pseudouridine synthase PUS6 KNAG_0E03690 [Huiozyma naganishii CBS 8797]|uniref:Pseudouridine synthase n=1 Tax=Huiozyma naganishii (strain ATCC MYA-139 / BCRC 22969 / CBS 8797 / KCTC 17520 / NBRC 10181 / NCYC 3082 / Yp74L-3) TaxID=1071383 RepID=J7S813_HUIN7|nr:hypothetical protein KNAG_0E03690 [Kazachstania naganishii CBS 8797]CCK70626.1 hypothetical protein KNAG_0E03690 [Kazachstania naganishii CBS 8797]